jgi:hypothetical protein
MKGEKRELNLNWNCRGDVLLRTKIWSPTIKIHAMRPHKIWPTVEYQIFIFLKFKQEHKKTLTTEGGGDLPFYEGFPALIDPNCKLLLGMAKSL